jgi:hypothetical protein
MTNYQPATGSTATIGLPNGMDRGYGIARCSAYRSTVISG